MSGRARLFSVSLLFATMAAALSGAHAEDVDKLAWQVGKSSGQVWLTTSGVQPASLTDPAVLKPGDTVRTGRNGRVLLTRGQETILIAPDSIVTIPPATAGPSSTTIVQQAGSILLDVEKRHSRSFDVETPYLVAAVKGTRFRVSVADGNASVAVLRGKVQVADNRSGRYALVLPGQAAHVAARGGLSLSGAGTLGPILQGEPHPSSVQRVEVPRHGLSAPAAADGRQVRALGAALAAARAGGRGQAHAAGGLRIGMPLGEVRLDIQKVTRGLAHGSTAAASANRSADRTVWSSGDITPGNGVGKTYNLGNNGSGSGLGGGNGGSGGSASAGGNGNGNAYGLNGGNGIGNAYGLGNGNGNNNGNGNGHGNGKGNGKN